MSVTVERAHAGRETDRWTGWQRLTLGGLAGLVAFTVVLQIVVGIVIPPVTVFGVAFGVMIGLCLMFGERRRWPWIVAGVGGGLFVLGNLPVIIEDLAHPETPFIFVPIVLGLAAAFLVVAGAVATVVRSALPPAAALAVAGAVSIAAMGVSGVAVAGLEQHEARAGDVPVVVERAVFPSDVVVQGGSAALFVDNRDRFRHTLVIDELGVHVELPGSTGRRIELVAAAGEYRFYCDVPGHEAMEGILAVR